jgi:hypothetical protein
LLFMVNNENLKVGKLKLVPLASSGGGLDATLADFLFPSVAGLVELLGGFAGKRSLPNIWR